MLDLALFKTALSCKCPKCGKGDLYPSRFNLAVNKVCSSCGLNLGKNDSADGPAVLLIFLLGASLVPIALLFENIFAPPLWVHGLLWGSVAIALTIGSLRPIKSYIIALQFKHRPGDWQ
jgi:uncharacterized protein (DUF983 family)